MSAATRLLLATGRTGLLAVLSFCSGFGLLAALILLQWWPNIEAVLLGSVAVDLVRLPAFFITTLKGTGSQARKIVTDVIVACVVAAAFAGTLLYNPEPSWQSRGIILCVGVFAIGLQILLGLRQHQALRELFFRPQDL